MSDLDELARRLSAEGLAPDVALGCAARDAASWRRVVGGDVTRFFDLASLTKPMTAVGVVAAGIDRTTTLGALVPELADTKTGPLSMELLLSHRAGLEAHIPLYQPAARGEAIQPLAALRDAANARREDAAGDVPAQGFSPVYSDLGYALAGLALARVAASVDSGAAVHRLVVEPLGDPHLGTARELMAQGVNLDQAAAPTEDVAWRGGIVRGRVHDENAWALTGVGGSGHAGMFGTVDAVLRFGEAVLDALSQQGPFGHLDLSWLISPRAGGTLRAGFDGKSVSGSSAGSRFGAESFGHLGFTGTSLWIDPAAKVVASLLTNRVHPSRRRAAEAIKLARPRVHDTLHQLGCTLTGG